MEYKIECVVKSVRMDGELRFTFEPTSKYQVEFGGKKIFIAVNEVEEQIVTVKKDLLSDKVLDATVDSEMLKILCATGRPITLTVKVEDVTQITIVGLK